MPDENPKTISCVRCGNTYEAFTSSQAYDCACDVKEDRIVGAYGSSVLDMQTVHFQAGFDHGLPEGQICDTCIRHLQDHGELTEAVNQFDLPDCLDQ